MRITSLGVALFTLSACSRYEYRPAVCPAPVSHSAIAWQYTQKHPRALDGVIVAIDSLRPLPTAVVSLDSSARHWRVDAAGRFRIDSLAPGTHTLRITVASYTVAEAGVLAEETSGIQVVAALERYRIALDGCGAVILPVRKPWWKVW
jgi:hypothetical protein